MPQGFQRENRHYIMRQYKSAAIQGLYDHPGYAEGYMNPYADLAWDHILRIYDRCRDSMGLNKEGFDLLRKLIGGKFGLSDVLYKMKRQWKFRNEEARGRARNRHEISSVQCREGMADGIAHDIERIGGGE